MGDGGLGGVESSRVAVGELRSYPDSGKVDLSFHREAISFLEHLNPAFRLGEWSSGGCSRSCGVGSVLRSMEGPCTSAKLMSFLLPDCIFF